MNGIRIAVAVVIGLIVVVALVPTMVLLDLASGGEGLGLCEGGIGTCRTSYFDGPELLAGLLVLLFLLLLTLRVLFRLQRRSLFKRRAEALDPVAGRQRRSTGL